jgi:hypothetical protein
MHLPKTFPAIPACAAVTLQILAAVAAGPPFTAAGEPVAPARAGTWQMGAPERVVAAAKTTVPSAAGATVPARFQELDDPAAMPGGLIVAGSHPGYLKYNGGPAVFLSGPDDPEGFLYLGTLNPDGTRSGGKQEEIIERMARAGVNAFHCQIFRMRRCNIKDEGDDTHCPFIDHDPAKPLNPAVLNQWDGWLSLLGRAGINVHFEFYNDATDVHRMGWTPDAAGNLHPDEHRFIVGIVERFKHHPHLLWGIKESSNKLPRDRVPHFKKIGELIAKTDNFNHPIVQSFVVTEDPEGDSFAGMATSDDYAGDPHIRVVTWLHIVPHGDDLEKQYQEYRRWAEREAGRFVVMKNETFYQRYLVRPPLSRQYMWTAAMAGLHSLEAQHKADRADHEHLLREDGRLAAFMNQTDFHLMTPRNDLAAGSTKWVLANPGVSYIAYTYAYRDAMGVRNLPAGPYDLLWFDTENGTQVEQKAVQVTSATPGWTKPDHLGSELALYVRRSAAFTAAYTHRNYAAIAPGGAAAFQPPNKGDWKVARP